MAIGEVIAQWVEQLRDRGLREGMDQFDICLAALSYLGRPYGQFEDLNGAFIDCSTLTSQAHWAGAQIGIPFIADSQRVARNGRAVKDLSQVSPGDVVVRYATAAQSPDGRHNHVAIYLGDDERGQPFVVEAKGGERVVITPFREFPAEGGIRRFWGQRRVSGASASEGRRLAETVPKLARLGARQYLVDGGRQVHLGVDIYRPAKTALYAPFSGKVSALGPLGLLIEGEHWIAELLGVIPLNVHGAVSTREVVALVSPSPHDPHVEHSETMGRTHVEVRLRRRASGMKALNYPREVRLGRMASII